MIDDIKERIEVMHSKQMKCHIVLTNGRFYNGMITEVSDAKWISFNERLLGEIVIWLSDIKVVEPYVGKVEE